MNCPSDSENLILANVFDMIVEDVWDETLEQFAVAIRKEGGKAEDDDLFVIGRMVELNWKDELRRAIERKIERG